MATRYSEVENWTEKMPFKYRTRKLIKPEDLNCRGALFGGRLLSWIDEECGIYSACQMKRTNIITKYMSEMNFISSATNGEVLEIGVETAKIGRTFLSTRCHVRTMQGKRDIIKIETVTFVALNAQGRPERHALSHLAGMDPQSIALKPEGDLSHLSVAI